MADVLCTPWLPPYGQSDAGEYVPRPMLEPILEETTDDEDASSTTQSVSSVLTAPDASSWYDDGGLVASDKVATRDAGGAWSSDSETGSVIRVDFNIDQDTLSEREFACPVKRRRQNELVQDEEEVQLRHPPGRGVLQPNNNLNDNVEFKFRIDFADATDAVCKRFRVEDTNDFFADADALSFSSLSRSSSLIQFESLERQLIENAAQSGSFGGSTPSLYSVQSGSGSTAGGCDAPYFVEPLKISSRNYYDIDQIDFSKAPFLNGSLGTVVATTTTAATVATAAAIAPPHHLHQHKAQVAQKHQQLASHPTANAAASPTTTKHRLFVAAASSSSENSLYSDGSESSPPIIAAGTARTAQHHQQQTHPHEQQQQSQQAAAATFARRSKNSVENLSEDSGYGEQQQQLQQYQYGQLRQRSRSIPNFRQHDHYLIEEEEPSGGQQTASGNWDAGMMHKSLEHNMNNGSESEDGEDDDAVDDVDSAADAYAVAAPEIDRETRRGDAPQRNTSVAHQQVPQTTTTTTTAYISASLPDILEHIGAFGENAAFDTRFDIIGHHSSSHHRSRDNRSDPLRSPTTSSSQRRRHHRPSQHQQPQQHRLINVYASPPAGRRRSAEFQLPADFSIISSVPSCLNICISTGSLAAAAAATSPCVRSGGYDWNAWNVSTTTTTASSNSTSVRHTAYGSSSSSAALVVVGGGGGGAKNTQRRAATSSTAAATSVASQNLDLCDFETATTTFRHHRQQQRRDAAAVSSSGQQQQQVKVINASYSNLTVLDYSGRRDATTSAIHTFRAMAEQRKQQQLANQQINQPPQRPQRNNADAQPTTLCKGNFLLDEISAHFDRNLSILNDRREHGDSADPADRLIRELAAVANTSPQQSQQPPVAPPRKPHQHKPVAVTSSSASSSIIDLQPATYEYTFDRDPTNLVTAYAASLERCNFELNSSAQNVNETPLKELSASNTAVHHQHGASGGHHHLAAPGKRQPIMVSSTPNLCHTEDGEEANDGHHHHHLHRQQHAHEAEDYHSPSSTATAAPHSASLNPMPSAVSAEGGLQGILAGGSRNSLGKGVSFCPVVSEISWKEQSSEEYVEGEYDDVDDDEEDEEVEDGRYDSGSDNNDDHDDHDQDNNRINVASSSRNRWSHDSQQQQRSTTAPDRDIVVQIAHDVDDDSDNSGGADNINGNGRRRAGADHDDAADGYNDDADADVSSTAQTPIERASNAITTTPQQQSSTASPSPSSSFGPPNAIVQSGNNAQHDDASNKHNNVDDDDDNNSPIGFDRAAGANRNSAVRVTNENVSVAQTATAAARNSTTRAPTTTTINNTATTTPPSSSSATTTDARRRHADPADRAPLSTNGGAAEIIMLDHATNEAKRPHHHDAAAVTTAIIAAETSHGAATKQQLLPLGTDAIRPEKPVKPKSGGFLSRFTGFRFSLRGGGGAKKKAAAAAQNNNAGTGTADKRDAKSGKKLPTSPAASKTNAGTDYIYIPLKEPLQPVQYECSNNSDSGSSHYTQSTLSAHGGSGGGGGGGSSSVTASVQSSPNASMVFRAGDPQQTSTPTAAGGRSRSASSDPHHQHVVVTTKPPLPKQPPRIVGVSAKQTTPPHQSSSSSSSASSNSPHIGGGVGQQRNHPHAATAQSAHAHQQLRAVSVPREINDYDSDYESSVSATTPRYDDGRSQHGDGGYDASNSNSEYNDDAGAPNGYNYGDDDSSVGLAGYYDSRRRYTRGGMSGSKSGRGGGADDVDDAGGADSTHRIIGLIETNLDTHETVISGKTRSLMELGPQQHHNQHHPQHYQQNQQPHPGGSRLPGHCQRTSSNAVNRGATMEPRRPHKSMEFLLDKENQRNVLPPENELQKLHDNNAALSEHQLRVQASLQRLNIPDWYKQYTAANAPAGGGRAGHYVPGSFAKKRNSDTTGSTRWAGLNSKTTSLSTLAGRAGGGGGTGSDRSHSPVMLSPSAHSHHGVGQSGGQSGAGFQRWSTSHLCSTQTSPSVSQRSSFSRGGTPNASMMSSGGAPVAYGGTVGGSSVRSSFRQPYMGWRSQEKLAQPRTPSERLASSLLARQQSKHHQQQQQLPSPQQQQTAATAAATTTTTAAAAAAASPEIQSSIKEVTSAIVHFVNDHTRPSHSRSRSTSPTTRKCWLESSFVGNRPLDSPQTPTIEQSFGTAGSAAAVAAASHRRSSDNTRVNGGATNIFGDLQRQQQQQQHQAPPLMSPGSATLEDVLASLLGLPANQNGHQHQHRFPDHHPHRTTANDATVPPSSSYHRLQIDAHSTAMRRRSEGDAQRRNQATSGTTQQPLPPPPYTAAAAPQTTIPGPAPHATQRPPTIAIGMHRPTSTEPATSTAAAAVDDDDLADDIADPPNHPDQLVRCRYPRCEAPPVTPALARQTYKTCHNCAHQYCSRECRRAHWDRHRRACLHSRVSALCRQVLAACKDDPAALLHLSRLARRGHAAHGRGVVRLLFRTADSAEAFVQRGFQALGEASYVRWPELQPQEMGPELYAELLRLSTEYKPDSKMLVYVAVCVVSETPAAAAQGGGAVRWERQLVSRCAKLKLSRTAAAAVGAGGAGTTAARSESGGTTEVLLAAQPAVMVDEATSDEGNSSQRNGAEEHAEHPEKQQQQQQHMDVLVLTFATAAARTGTVEQRAAVQSNIVAALRERGVHLRKHFPDVFQRLVTFVEGTGGAERFAPVTIHPRDALTGRTFLCIIMAQARRRTTDGDGDGGADDGVDAAALMRLHEGMMGDGGTVRVIDCAADQKV